MQIEHYLLLSIILIGIGLSAALSQRNIIAVIMAVMTASFGVLIVMVALDVNHLNTQKSEIPDGTLFALCLGATMLAVTVLGCAMAYRRFMSSGTTNIGDKNKLRH